MIEKSSLPESALLQKYVRSGAYTDCYSTKIAADVSLVEFVTSFYTTWLFKLERFILRVAVKRPSTDEEAVLVATGDISKFAAWSVEDRADDQLLMCDFQNRTRSWFMVVPGRLYFGSAVVPVRDPDSGKTSLGTSYRLLLGFHRLYSRLLLAAAKSRLQ
jgi:hypothetical protein